MTDPARIALAAALAPAYTLTSELGGGGMSRVYVAREVALDRDVVVKVLSRDLLDGLSVERFTREIRLAAALQDPHIVPVLAAGTTADGLPWYTMPYVQGASLRQRLNEGRVPHVESLRWLRDVSQALAYAHARGVVHRDIKPENILLSNGSALVTDFGLAKAIQVARTQENVSAPVHGLTRTGMSLGTPAYMAPEQAAGDPGTDHRADLYAWGLVAYEVLAGRHPFAEKSSSQQLLAAQIVEVPRALGEVAPEVSTLVAALVTQCLEKEPAHRPGSATELLRVLDDVRSQGSSPAVAPKRRAVSPLTLAVGAALVMAVAAGMWWRASERDSKPSTTAGPVMMAVLPFEHAGPADQQPFTDGLTDAVTAKLGALSSLMVIDRRSAATYRGTTKSTQQIGTELGVRYLLEGVVRWAKDGAGVWRARVTPTLVDAKSGAIRWTGEPATVTLEDPFTAQGSIATDVAAAMEVAVLPKEREVLKRRFTDSPQAFAAYQRGVSLLDAISRRQDDDATAIERYAVEMERAIALDSNFTMAWGMLANARVAQAWYARDDRAVRQRAFQVLRMAEQRAPSEPFVHLAAASAALGLENDLQKARAKAAISVELAPNDPLALAAAAKWIRSENPDSAKKLIIRAARLDPRSSDAVISASAFALWDKDFTTARHYADAALTIDSADERAWGMRFQTALVEGDSVELRKLSAVLLKYVPRPGINLAGFLIPANVLMSRWYLAYTAHEQRLFSFIDSLIYLDNRIDAGMVIGDERIVTTAADDMIHLVSRAPRDHRAYPDGLVILAYAQAASGRPADARKSLSLAFNLATKTQHAFLKADEILDTDRVAATYARLAEVATTIAWLEKG